MRKKEEQQKDSAAQDEPTYEQAMERLESITREMEAGRIGIDLMADRLREARRLLDYCRMRLTNAEKNCNSLLDVEEKE